MQFFNKLKTCESTRGRPSVVAWSLAAAVVASVFAPVSEARITKIVIDLARSESPTFDGKAFGPSGKYEKLRGVAYGELDPTDPLNAVITDIGLAPKNARGMVEYQTDIFILKPMNEAKGNHRILVDVNNRGAMRLGSLNGVPNNNNPTTAADAGNGYVMREGYTVVANGWDPGATGEDSIKISVPTAKNPDGSSITGPSYEYIVFDNATSSQYGLTYPAATLDKSQATLTVRAKLDDAPTAISSDGWEYTSSEGTAIRLLPAGTPFAQSAIYEFTYTAKDPIVAGIGLAATRDVVSFLRRTKGAANPVAGAGEHVYSYSISQPSRYLNDFIYFGMNEDEDGRKVIDGIVSHTAGGDGDQINYRFAQNGRTERNRQNHLYPEAIFPFAHQNTVDQFTGKTDGRDVRCHASQTCPFRFEINTANEYWVKAGSLLHTNTRGKDLADPLKVRYYLVSGTSHSVGNSASRSTCQQFLNPISPYPMHRAMLKDMDNWVTSGIEPPESQIPRATDGAFAIPVPGSQVGVVPAAVLGWPNIPGVTYTGVITTRYNLDFGPRLDEGIVDNIPPSVNGRPSYPIFVSKVDQDGNEISGVRMPGVAAPIATTTGWALRSAAFGGNDGCESSGQWIPFAKTKAEREATGDPRLSLQERYKNHAGYVRAVRQAAQGLRDKGFLLQEDVKRFVDEAEASDILQ